MCFCWLGIVLVIGAIFGKISAFGEIVESLKISPIEMWFELNVGIFLVERVGLFLLNFVERCGCEHD